MSARYHDRKPWEIPISYTDEPSPSKFQSTDTEPLDYSRGPHDAILGDEDDDDDDEPAEAPPPDDAAAG